MMGNLKTIHTKGEWSYETSIIKGNRFEINNAVTNIAVIPDYSSVYDHETAEANAKLIAAAPDLLEAASELRDLLTINLGDEKANKLRDSLIKYCPELISVKNKAQKAIDKATK